MIYNYIKDKYKEGEPIFFSDIYDGTISKPALTQQLSTLCKKGKGDLMLQFDGTKTKAVYRFKTDVLLKHNLVGQLPEQGAMEKQLKAIIQQYMSRMNENRLLPDK